MPWRLAGAIAAASGIPALVRLSRSGSEAVRDGAAGALANMRIGGRGNGNSTASPADVMAARPATPAAAHPAEGQPAPRLCAAARMERHQRPVLLRRLRHGAVLQGGVQGRTLEGAPHRVSQPAGGSSCGCRPGYHHSNNDLLRSLDLMSPSSPACTLVSPGSSTACLPACLPLPLPCIACVFSPCTCTL